MGLVQRVGYRYFVYDRATALGVVGWVRNRPDGGVEAFIQGSEQSVDAMIEALGEGPHHARVQAVHCDAVATEPGLDGFDIRF